MAVGSALRNKSDIAKRIVSVLMSDWLIHAVKFSVRFEVQGIYVPARF